MSSSFDVVVGGGSVAGLSFAAEGARRGLRVLVLEEDERVGEPEKCDGLISLKALAAYIAPASSVVQSHVKRGTVFAPSGASLVLDTSKLDVAVIDRSAYDQQILDLAVSNGAEVLTSSRVQRTHEEDGGVTVKVGSGGEYRCKYYVDATGPSALVRRNREGLIPAAKYEVRGDWFKDGEVQVHLDRTRYPGFFAWVIPRGEGLAKVGVAGSGINTFRTLDSFLATRSCEVVTKVAAPIYVGGPLPEVVLGRTILVGESAGQVKPTTAGGILGSLAAGTIAAHWAAESIRKGDRRLLANYQADWEERFGREFRMMRHLRRVFTELTNDDMDRMVAALSSKRTSEKLASSDFDFHATALLWALGVRGTLRLASLLFSAEARETLLSLVK